MAEKKRKLNRKRVINTFIIFALIVWWFNNYTLKTTETAVESPKISQPVRIALISDMHLHGITIPCSTVRKKIDDISPDVVFVLGDMYSRKSTESEKEKAADFIEGLADDYPTYYVNGDHDMDKKWMASLAENGVHVMDYKEEYAEINGNTFQIMGIDNAYYTTTFDLSREFAPDRECCSILLAHIPNYRAFSKFGADFTFCADTHGGMVRLPLIGTLFDAATQKYFPTFRNIDVYDKGWFSYNGGKMFITSGIGAAPIPVRFYNRPEVVCLDILPV